MEGLRRRRPGATRTVLVDIAVGNPAPMGIPEMPTSRIILGKYAPERGILTQIRLPAGNGCAVAAGRQSAA